MTNTRTRPLSAPPVDDLDLESVVVDDGAIPDPDVDEAARLERFSAGVRELKVGSASIVLSERILLVLGGIIAPLGIIAVVLGWYGASQTPHLFEQVPYLISGGLLGVALVFLGSFFYFTHWITQLVKEQRTQSAAVVSALERLQELLLEVDED